MQADFEWEIKIAQATGEMFPPRTAVFAPYRDPPPHQSWLHGRHKGVTLAPTDPKAWAGSIAFPEKRPSRKKIEAHVRWCIAQGLLLDKIPVAWSFGKVYWETVAQLRPWTPLKASA